jgi:hypothetical protein
MPQKIDWKDELIRSAKTRTERSSLGSILAPIILFGVFIAVQVLRSDSMKSQIDQWLGHDQIVRVISESWVEGEYKQCTNPNVKTETVVLACGGDGDGKLFKVTFHGVTFTEEQSPQIIFRWSCRKNNGEDAVIVCRAKAE